MTKEEKHELRKLSLEHALKVNYGETTVALNTEADQVLSTAQKFYEYMIGDVVKEN